MGALAAAIAPAIVLSPAPAVAANPCVPAGYSASAGADLLKLSALDVGPLGLQLNPVADVTIGEGRADMAHAQARHASARATYLAATLAGIPIPPAVLDAHAAQDAPPVQAGPDTHSVISLHTPVLSLGAGNVTASAGTSGAFSCGDALSDASVVDARVLPGTHGRSLLAVPHNLNGTTHTSLVTTGGTMTSTAVATAGLTEIDLLGGTAAEIGVKVVTEPTLTGRTGGTLATSSVDYTSPILDVTLPGGAHVTLDAAHTSLDATASATGTAATGLGQSLSLPLVGHPAAKGTLHFHLEIGELTRSVTAHAVSAHAATLRVTVSLSTAATVSGDGGGPVLLGSPAQTSTLLELGLGLLSVTATAPAQPGGYPSGGTPGGGGYGGPTPTPTTTTTRPPSPTPSPTPSTSPSTGGQSPTPIVTPKPTPTSPVLARTGNATTWVVAAGAVLLLIGRLVIVLARRRAIG
jgi:hypothetical protein